MYNPIKNILELIKFSHSIFALPFAMVSWLVASHELPPLKRTLLILVAMVSARSAAMAFNRLVDAEIDAKNPRTQDRQLPRKILSKETAAFFTLFCSLIFMAAAYNMNRLAFYLSPLALAIILGYSFSKRFTSLSHFWLGVSLGIAPVAVWIAVTAEVGLPSLWLGAAVTFWVAGFDIIYSTQDFQFDRDHQIHSIPAQWGLTKALWISRACHLTTLLCLWAFGASLHFDFSYLFLVAAVAGAFLWEHSLVKSNDLSNVNAAFFTVNGWVSIGYFLGVCLVTF